jgi:ketosteroid isomerase-like protein
MAVGRLLPREVKEMLLSQMRRHCCRWPLIVAVVLAGCAAPPGGSAEDKALVQQLTDQADRWDQAIVRKDRAAIEANMAEGFRQIDRAGNVADQKAFVDGLVSPDLQIDPYTVEDFDVRVYGDAALLSGRTRMTGRYQGQPFTSHYRFIDVYVRRYGAWKVVSVQISPILDATLSR